MPSGLASRLGECELRAILAKKLFEPSSAALYLASHRLFTQVLEKGQSQIRRAHRRPPQPVSPQSGGLPGRNSFRNNTKRRLAFFTLLLLLAYAERCLTLSDMGCHNRLTAEAICECGRLRVSRPLKRSARM